MPTIFYLIRHGLTDAIGNHMSGRAPGVHLNEEGLLQVNRLAESLAGLQVDALYASPLERTRQTAEALAHKWKVPVQAEDDFLELDIGKWTGWTFAELDADPAWPRFNTFRSGTRMPGGETMLEVQARAVRGLEKLMRAHASGKVAVVSHGDVLRVLICYYLGVPIDLMQRFEIEPASLSILAVNREGARLRLLNGKPGHRIE